MPSDADRLREIAEIPMEYLAGTGRADLREIAARLEAPPALPGVPAEVREAAEWWRTGASKGARPSDDARACDSMADWILAQPTAPEEPHHG